MKRIASLFLALALMCGISINAFAESAETPVFFPDVKENLIISQAKKTIEVDNIMQYPELPTGCETVALTILLNHLGFPADKVDIARNYLPKLDFYWENGILYGADYKTTFAGDPESEYAYGCFAPCIITAANKYLTDKGYNSEAIDLTGITFDELLTDYIDRDIPVLIWITGYNLIEPYESDEWNTPEGYKVRWIANEHCVVLTGYDSDEGLIYVADPLVGNTSYEYDRIKQRYEQLGQQAVYIRQKSDDTKTDTDSEDTENSDSDTTDTEKNDTDSEIGGKEYNTIGDVNGDKKVSAKDSIILQRYVINMEKLNEAQLAVSDVNYDGKVTNKDSMSILRHTISMGDSKNIGKSSKYSIIGEWTYTSGKGYLNIQFSEDGTVITKDSNIPWTIKAKWTISDNIVTVTRYGKDEVYTYRSNTLVQNKDSNVVCIRGTTIPATPETPDVVDDKQTPDEAEQTETPSTPNRRVLMNVKNILQNPDLPTGAECVSLVMVMNYYGFDADKFEIVRKYLPKQDFYYVDGELYGADFRTTFAGDPESEDSYGCYAPCIVTTAKNYFADKNIVATVSNLTSTDFETLISHYIDGYAPVIVWITNNNLEPSSLSTVWKTPDGETVQWRRPEHCVVLTGYDLEKKVVYVSDPLYGNTEYDYDTFVARYNEMGKQAVCLDVLNR